MRRSAWNANVTEGSPLDTAAGGPETDLYFCPSSETRGNYFSCGSFDAVTLASDDRVRRVDTVRLSATSVSLGEGAHYAQLAHELHDSRQQRGTVTIIRCAFKDVAELTVCRRDEDRFVSGRARPATLDEVKRIAGSALAWF